MNALEAYGLYMHLKLHFTSKAYDVRKYPSKFVNSETFMKSNIRFRIQKLATKYSREQLQEFFVANFLAGDKYGGVYSGNAEDVYLDWQKRVQGLTYLYTQDLTHLRELIEQTLEPSLWYIHYKDSHPPMLREFIGKRISIETLVILDALYDFRAKYDEWYEEDIMWKPISLLIYKYQPFLTFSREDFFELTNTMFLPHTEKDKFFSP